MRRHRQQLADDESLAILSRATSGVLAIIGDGGYPYAVPLSFVYHDNHLYFHSAREGHKIDAVRQDERCSFCVIDRDDVHPAEFTTYFRSVIAFGRIHIVEDDGERMEALRLLGRHYAPCGHELDLQHEIDKGMPRVTLLRMDIEHMTGKQAIELTH